MKSAKQKERELIIELSSKGKSTYQISDILGVSQTKASFWIRRYKRTNDLNDRSRSGRPTPLTKKKLNFIADAIKSKVLEPNNKSGISSKEVLKLIESQTDKKYTLRHVQRILHRIGFSLITPRVNHIKKNKEAQNKFRREFKKNFRKNIWVIQS